MLDQSRFKKIALNVASLLLGLGTIHIASADTSLKKQVPSWDEFKIQHHKDYKSDEEEKDRKKIFLENLERIEKLNDENEKVNGERPFGITQFTDLSPSEFAKIYLTYVPSKQTHQIAPPDLQMKTTDPLPEKIDWTTKGAVTPVKNQGNCGACWAFSAIEQLETAIYMKTGKLPPLLSAQQVNSCSTEDGGCNGGDTLSAYGYMINSGVQSEESYPYTSGRSGSTGSCKYDATRVVAKMAAWQYAVPACTRRDSSCAGQPALEPALQQAIVTKGPASICLNATPWQYYKGGVLATCDSDLYSMNHCVQLVGYDATSQDNSYWILRNQWGTNWGENGHIYLKMGNNTCGLTNEATYVTPIVSPAPSPTPTSTPTPTPTPSKVPNPKPPTPVPAPSKVPSPKPPTPVPVPSKIPSPKPSPTPQPTPTKTPIPVPAPTILPPGEQEGVDFNNVGIGTKTTCRFSKTTQVVTCQVQLSTPTVPFSTPNSTLSAMLDAKTETLAREVRAIRPEYYQTLTCSIDASQTWLRRTNRHQKYMVGTAVCQH